MNRSWEPIIRASWINPLPSIRPFARSFSFLVFLYLALCIPNDGFAKTAVPVQKHRPVKTRSTVKPPAPKAVGAAGLIAIAQHQLESGNSAAAAEYAKKASSDAPVLDDYAQFIRAQAEYRLKNYEEVAKTTVQVLNHLPVSPFAGPAGCFGRLCRTG